MNPLDTEERPTFTAPWQAQAFAMAVHLNAQGAFTWPEWAEVFSTQRRRSAEEGTADAPDQYYHDWLAALEQLLIAKNHASADLLGELKQAWVEAYLRTPHGEPVKLQAEVGTVGETAK